MSVARPSPQCLRSASAPLRLAKRRPPPRHLVRRRRPSPRSTLDAPPMVRAAIGHTADEGVEGWVRRKERAGLVAPKVADDDRQLSLPR